MRRPTTKPAAPADLAGAATLHGEASLDRLTEALLTVDAGSAPAALRALAATPRVIARLDEHARRVRWWTPDSVLVGRVGRRLRHDRANPVALALATTHGDGHVRERAVERLLAAPHPDLVPFLVLRTADWVGPVRDRARAGLALLLADDPDTYLPAALAMAVLGNARHRGGFAHTQAVASLLAAPPELRERLLATGGRAERRLILQLGLSHGWWPPETVLAAAPDVSVRVRAAEAACRQAVWTRQLDTLRRLARHRHTEVRAVALTGLVRAGEDGAVAAHLADTSPLIRAIARDAARRAGVDALGHYRAAVTGAEPAPGAIAGLAETGGEAETPLLRALLTHPSGRVRAAAVRALRQLDAVPVDETVPLLRDPSPAVVREATAALRPFTRRVPDEVARALLTDPHRAELRQAGYRLLYVRGVAERLRAALLLATDPDPRLARRAVADATGLAREAASPGWGRRSWPALDVPAARIAELADLTDKAAPALRPGTTRMLHAWLAASPP